MVGIPLVIIQTDSLPPSNGNEHTITGLAIQRDQDGIGFFGEIGTGVSIRNVGLLDNLSDYTGNSASSRHIGGLVGFQHAGSVVASYTTGNADGGEGSNDIGSLAGRIPRGSIFASFGFGTTMNVDTAGLDGTIISNSAWTVLSTSDRTAARLTLAIVNDPNDASGNPDDNRWNSASDSTKDAWDFGTSSQAPALKYADYDGTGTMFHCESDADNAPAGAILIPNCGELIPGQR